MLEYLFALIFNALSKFIAPLIFYRELLKLGFRVRAGVRSAQKAEALVQV